MQTLAGSSGDGSVGKVIELRAARPDNRASIPGRGKDFSLYLMDFLRDPASILFSRYWKFCHRKLSCRNVKLRTPICGSTAVKNAWRYTSFFPHAFILRVGTTLLVSVCVSVVSTTTDLHLKDQEQRRNAVSDRNYVQRFA